MTPIQVDAVMNLSNLITEVREVSQALDAFADRLEQIEQKYADKDNERQQDEL